MDDQIQLAGRGQVKQVDALLASINALARAEMKAEEFYQKGDYSRAALFYFYSLLKYSQRTVQGLDAAQREMVEYPENAASHLPGTGFPGH